MEEKLLYVVYSYTKNRDSGVGSAVLGNTEAPKNVADIEAIMEILKNGKRKKVDEIILLNWIILNNKQVRNKMEDLKEASEIVTVFYKMNESGKQLHEVLPEIQKMIDGYKKDDIKVNSILTEKIKVSSK